MKRIGHLVWGKTKTGAISSVKRIIQNYNYDDSQLVLIAYGDPVEGIVSNAEVHFLDLKFSSVLSDLIIYKIRKVHYIPYLILTFFIDQYKLRKFCKVNSIGILHLHHFPDIFQFSFLSSKKLKIVSHIRAIVNKKLWGGIPYKLFRHFVKKNSNSIIGISSASLDALSLTYNRKSTIIYNGLEGLAKTSNPQLEAKIADSFVIGSVIRFTKLKGIYLYFDTFFEYYKNHPDSPTKFLLVAPARDESSKAIRDELLSRVEDQGLSNKLIYFDHFPDYSYIMPYINILFHTTLHREGFGNVVLEANWFGKPVVSTPCLGVNDIIKNGVSGYILKEYDSHDSCQIIRQLENNTRLYNQMSREAYNIAHSDKFSITSTISQLHNLYMNI